MLIGNSVAAQLAGLPNVAYCGCHVYKTADQLINSGSDQALQFDGEDHDQGGWHDNVTNNTRITVPAGKGGYIKLAAKVTMQELATSHWQWWIRKNGATEISSAGVLVDSEDPNATYITRMLSVVVNAAAGDYFEVMVNQGTGSQKSIYSRALDTVWETGFMAQWLGV